MISIPAGSFLMGSENSFDWEKPRHRVSLDAFEMSATTVTHGEFAEFLASEPRAFPKGWNYPELQDPNQPVVGVSWFDAVVYCKWLGKGFRLPTEAEWEYACRGGVENAEYSWGNEPPESLERLQGEWLGPRPVGLWEPNGFGLFNMGDNVHEWCQDWYAPDYYATSPAKNPKGPEEGTRRVSRGGSWRHLVKGSRAAQRSSLPPELKYTDYGFRVVRDDRIRR